MILNINFNNSLIPITYSTSPISDENGHSIIAGAVPLYLPLKNRQLIYEALANLGDKSTINLIPQPATSLIAYNSLAGGQALTGDILLINTIDVPSYFSFLSFNHNTGELTIEAQSPLLSPLDATTIDIIINQAKKIGFYSYNWQLDNVLLLSNKDMEHDFLQSTISTLPVISSDVDNPYQGLIRVVSSSLQDRISAIYPHDFYIEKYDQEKNTSHLELIPFASEVLALDVLGKYTMANFPVDSTYNLSKSKNQVLFKIYEIDRETPPNDPANYSEEITELCLGVDNSYLTGSIDIIIDLLNSKLKISHSRLTNPELTMPLANIFPSRAWIPFAQNTFYPQEFQRNLQELLGNAPLDTELALAEEIQFLKYELLTLLAHLA